MTKRERIKDMIGYIDEFLENLEAGYDVLDNSFIIKYKDGTIKYISCDDDNKFSRNISKIDYIVGRTPDNEWDTEGKSWLRDFVKFDIFGKKPIGSYDLQESLDRWTEYVESKLYP